MNLNERPRRLRTTAAMRNLVAEVRLNRESLILPLFVREGLKVPKPIESMLGVVQHTKESLNHEIELAITAGIGGIMIFGIPEKRDATGSEAFSKTGVLTAAVRQARAKAGDKLVIIADLCLDEFTDHGHCGVLNKDGSVDNDKTLEAYARMALVLADAGADLLGASGMMDGQVGYVRAALDKAGHTNVGILAYAAKYASSFYGPFRDAVESQLDGDRHTYQQDPRNLTESLREVRLDIAEGADIVMVKPGLPYIDVLRAVTQEVDVPTASYVVSGEYAMIEAAAALGSIDRKGAILETLTAVRRAGATVICTYWALEVADWIS